MNKLLGHGENFLVKHYAGDVVYTVTGKLVSQTVSLESDYNTFLSYVMCLLKLLYSSS